MTSCSSRDRSRSGQLRRLRLLEFPQQRSGLGLISSLYADPGYSLIGLGQAVGRRQSRALLGGTRRQLRGQPLGPAPSGEDLCGQGLHVGTVCGIDTGYNDRR